MATAEVEVPIPTVMDLSSKLEPLQVDTADIYNLETTKKPTSSSFVCEWMPTSLRLPSSTTKSSPEEDCYLCLPVHISEESYFKQNETKEEFKDDGYCVSTAAQLRLVALNNYLANAAPLAASRQRLLFGDNVLPHQRRSKYQRQESYQHQIHVQQQSVSSHKLITSTNSGRVINVLQGEIAHCTAKQADVLVSDDATTCHIVALRSRCHRGGQVVEINDGIMASMTHVDGPGYDACLSDAVMQHFEHHSRRLLVVKNARMEEANANEPEECKENYTDIECHGVIELSVHIMGGFNDIEGSSIAITDNVLSVLAKLAEELDVKAKVTNNDNRPKMSMILETCAVSGANDDGTACPIGRGLALNVATGDIFLAEVEDRIQSFSIAPFQSSQGIGLVSIDGDIQLLFNGDNSTSVEGPDALLRSVRLWATAFFPCGEDHKLNIIHRSNEEYLVVDPFFFRSHAYAKELLNLSDAELLQFTSTSPAVEKANFARKVRKALAYMNGMNSTRVFVRDGAYHPIKYRRNPLVLNGWVRVE